MHKKHNTAGFRHKTLIPTKLINRQISADTYAVRDKTLSNQEEALHNWSGQTLLSALFNLIRGRLIFWL